MSSLIEQPVDDGPPALRTQLTAKNCEPAFPLTGRPTAVRYRALAWLTAAAGLAYLCRNAIGVPESAIREELGLTIRQSSWFLSAFFWSYAIFQIPSGWFSERFGTRIALSLFIL